MPELPEVEAMRLGLQEAGVPGSRILTVTFPPTPYRPITVQPGRTAVRKRLANRRIQAIERWGKAVLLVTDDGQRLAVEPRMTGLFLIQEPPHPQYLRMVIELQESRLRRLFFWDRRGLGRIHLWSARQYEQRRAGCWRGPDALTIRMAELQQNLATSRRPIKVALLDQQALSGIGNLYASEILHRAGIHPQQPCNQLHGDQWHRLHRAIRRVLTEAIRCGGSTLVDETYRMVNGQLGQYQHRHAVYQRTGRKCPTCQQGIITKIILAQRSTFFCPRCQRR